MTIMSYPCPGGSWPPVANLLSNPSRTFNNVPAGIATSAHCARQVTESRTRVASARATTTVVPTGGTITSGLNGNKCLDAPNFNSGTQVGVVEVQQ